MLRAVRSAFRFAAPIGFMLLAHICQAGQTELLSKVATESDTALGADFPQFPQPALSADGRWVAFSSTAVNLVSGQNAPYPLLNLYLHDRQTGTTALVTHAGGSPTASASGGAAEQYSMSDDGRWIVYTCAATNLVENQVLSSSPQIYLYDRDTGVNTLLSHSIQGPSIGSNGYASSPRISGDGNWIVYDSYATDLLAGQSDTPGTRDVFLQQRSNGLRILVSRATGTSLTAANHHSSRPSVSDNGRWVAFQSQASNLIPGFIPSYPSDLEIYLYDRSTRAMTLVSHTSASATHGAGGRQPRISPDGAAVLFGSTANNLVTGQIDPSSSFDRFLFDRASGTNVLVSHTASSPVASSGGVQPEETDADVAAGGAWVVFGKFVESFGYQIYLFRRSDATVTLVSRSVASPAQPANNSSSNPWITPDGAFVVFGSSATDLVPGQDGQDGVGYDAFLLDRASGTLALASGANGSGQVGSHAFFAGVSDDGSAVAYFTRANNLDAGTADLNDIPDVAIYDRASAHSAYATLHAPGQASATPALDSTLASASADGRYAVFLSAGPNLIPGQVDGFSQDVFLVDRTAGTTTLVSHAAGQTLVAGGWASDAAISADGNYVVFTSNSTNLVPGQIDTNIEEYGEGFEIPGTDVFLYDRAAGTTILVSHAAGSGVTAGSYASLGGVSLSADGSHVTFSSNADDLVPGQVDTNESPDVFLYDRVSGTTTLVSRKAGTAATAGNRHSIGARISGDGRWIGFSGEASDLVAGAIDPNLNSDVFLFDRVSGQTLLVTRAAGTAATAADKQSWGPRLNPDGRYLVFTSSSRNLVPGQNGPQSQNVFLFDRNTGTVELISRAAGTATTTVSDAQDSLVSDDGRYVVFRSTAPNLQPGQTAGPGTAKQNVFVHDRVTRQTELISRSILSPLQTSNHDAQPPAFSPDGRYVAFLSQATDLAPGSTGRDIYLADRQLHTLERVAAGTNTYLYPFLPPPFPRPQLSADGSVVLFISGGRDLAEHDFNAGDDVFAWTRSGPGTGDFFTVSPCRLIDTRQAGQGPALASGVPALLQIQGACGIPATARAVAVNVTALQGQGTGSLVLYPGNLSTPNTNTISFQAGQNLANNAILPLASNGEGTLGITPAVAGGGTVHVIVDVSGYFQ